MDAFEAALGGRVPDGALLSHDLFEGVFARAGLVTDIELFEEFPAQYEVATARQHRWTRGDWQLLPWIFVAAILPAIGRWKMLDNLRRSLSPPAAYLTLLLGWTLHDGLPLVWTRFVLLCLALPALVPVTTDVIPQRPGASNGRTPGRSARAWPWRAPRSVLAVTLLAHQAWLMADAVARTLVRLAITRRNMLEWVTAAQAGSRVEPDAGRALPAHVGSTRARRVAALVAGPSPRTCRGRSPARWSPSGSSRPLWPGG